jgi:hypothetical protein
VVHSISTSKTLRILLLTPFLWLVAARAQEPASPSTTEGTDDAWSALVASSEDLLDWSEDPLQDLDLDPEPEPEPMAFWSISARAGGGESTNFLKREIPESSTYLQLEGDAFVNLLYDKASLTTLVFFEFTQYEAQTKADSETLVFLHANWSLFRDLWTWGFELDALYGDQIYDASLSNVSAPLGENLRQIRPEFSFFVEKVISSRDSVGATLSLQRAMYGDSEEDYWRPEISAEWNRQWDTDFSSSTEAAVYTEFYDEESARRADGSVLNPQTKLRIHGLLVENSLRWQPEQWPSFKAALRAGLSAEADREGDYESSLRLFSSLNLTWKPEWVTLRIDGRWQNLRYRDRHSDFADTRPLRQTYRSLRLEAERNLIWNTSLRIGVEWSDFNSTDASESFSERRIEALLEWSY